MKAWQKPELVVLVRHQPQEAVLQLCKFDAVQQVAPAVEWGECWQSYPTGGGAVDQTQCGVECWSILPT